MPSENNENERKFKVYVHIAPNGKRYIGITSMYVNKRWGRGAGYKQNKYFTKAIKKYGWDNFKHEILYENLTKEEACAKEIELIKQFKSNNPQYGYNLSSGGTANIYKHKKATEETKKRMSEAQLKRYREHPLTEEQKRKMAETCRKNAKSIVYTPEVRKHMSDAHKGKPNYSARGQIIPEWQKELIRKANSGANNSKAKKVICLETLKVYDAIAYASNDTGCTPYGISYVCNNRKNKTNNLHWVFYDENKNDEYYKHLLKVKLSIERPSCKKIICVETNEIFDSMVETQLKTNINKSRICLCCKNSNYTAGGYHWKYA